jgi:hypothetical protein
MTSVSPVARECETTRKNVVKQDRIVMRLSEKGLELKSRIWCVPRGLPGISMGNVDEHTDEEREVNEYTTE